MRRNRNARYRTHTRAQLDGRVNPDSGYFLEGEDHNDPISMEEFPEDEATREGTLCWCSACHAVFDKKAIKEWHERSGNTTCPLCRSSKGFIPYGVPKTAKTVILRDEAEMITCFDTVSDDLQEMRKMYEAANITLDQANRADTKAATMRIRWQERKPCAPVYILDSEARVCNHFKRCQEARTACMRYAIGFIEDTRDSICTYLATLREDEYSDTIPKEDMDQLRMGSNECDEMVTFWGRVKFKTPETLKVQQFRFLRAFMDGYTERIEDRTYKELIHTFATCLGYLMESLGKLDHVLQAKGIPSWADRQDIEIFAEKLGDNDIRREEGNDDIQREEGNRDIRRGRRALHVET